jgi:hypothetical protein
MGYFLLGIALLAALVLLIFSLPSAKPAQLGKVIGGMAIVFAAAFGLFGLLTGRLVWAMLGLGGVAAMLLMRPSSNWLNKGGSSSGPGRSSIQTDTLRMELDHKSGQISGDILTGTFQGRRIESLERRELYGLLKECTVSDASSAQLIEAYLDRVSPDWRQDAGAEGTNAGGYSNARGREKMSRSDALNVLGLEEGFTEDQVREAHRRLMREHHPDRGGSDWIAAKLNEAKEFLLGGK